MTSEQLKAKQHEKLKEFTPPSDHTQIDHEIMHCLTIKGGVLHWHGKMIKTEQKISFSKTTAIFGVMASLSAVVGVLITSYSSFFKNENINREVKITHPLKLESLTESKNSSITVIKQNNDAIIQLNCTTGIVSIALSEIDEKHQISCRPPQS
ncbi:hypothetical protein [uncultured Cycloclasticus sp.]|uniref:hypothetical protein n=1 Tax=uncultured Cycloclasticus sp. TaxID=172194 RepID=UPI00258ADC6A|nr:hypothetical protein [uncultured Cycloclasticus sp.]